MRGRKPQAKQSVSAASTPPAKLPMAGLSPDLLGVFKDIAENVEMPAMARVSAARALAEVAGALGRHSRSPHDRAAQKPLAECSLADLRAEHARLRQRFAAYFRDE